MHSLYVQKNLFFRFFLENDESLRIKEVALATSNLTKTIEFWQDLLQMQVLSKKDNEMVLTYDAKTQANLRFVTSGYIENFAY